MRLLREFPLFVILMLIGSVSMVVPMLHAIRLEDWDIARAFFYHGTFFAIVSFILGLGTMDRHPRVTARYQLITLLMAYFLLPIMLAMPLDHVVKSIGWTEAYFEMLSSMTTTGASIFDAPERLAEPLHLWRAFVGWIGGFLFLLAALAVLEPMQLGGFEIESTVTGNRMATARRSLGGAMEANDRLIRQAKQLAPPYVALTAVLAIALMIAGDRAFVALCHAMSVLATSGITPLDGLSETSSGYIGEILIFAFLFLAVSHRWINETFANVRPALTGSDPEVKLALMFVLIVSSLLVIRHFIGAFEVEEQENFQAAAQAFWGSAFTVMSFLTTFGLVSADWSTAQSWSGLETPGLVLLGLSVIGGGVATTAGGIKLLRVYALYKHGLREMRRLVHPNSVGGAGMTARRIRREGAYIAWIFLMMFLLGLAVCMLLLTVQGVAFEDAMALSVASLTNTGPAINTLAQDLNYSTLATSEKAVLCIAMIFGRLEALVVIALFNPEYWRQ